MLSYKEKYLKYKEKYINFKNKGGTLVEIQNCMHSDYYIDDIIQQIKILKKMIINIIGETIIKKVISLPDFLYLEDTFNYVYNIQSFIGYYIRTLLIEMKESPNKESKHNELYNLLCAIDKELPVINGTIKYRYTLKEIYEKKKNCIDKFVTNNIKNELYNILNLLNNKDLLMFLQELLDKVLKTSEKNTFAVKQIIDVLNKYIYTINIKINNKLTNEQIKDESKYIKQKWSDIQNSETSNANKILYYRQMFLKFFENTKLTGYKNILSYHQYKEGATFRSFEDIQNILIENLIKLNYKHKLLEIKFDNKTRINTKEDFQKLHENFIKTKYGDVHNIINSNININNLIEGLRWIVYKYYNLLMIKSPDCSGYRKDIKVYNFYNKTTNILVGVIYFDLNYNQVESRGYIYEFRTKYNSIDINKNILVEIIPIICLYVDFKVVNLSEIKLKLFHEFGHAIHTILSQNHYQKLSPNTMKFDYVEIMSQFFELYIFEKEFINRFLVNEDISIRHIPDYDNLSKTKLYDSINFEEYFNESENIFFNIIQYLLICLLEIKLKVLSEEELHKLDIIDYSEKILQNFKTTYNLPNYVSYKTEVLKFNRIYSYPLYYVYIISLLKVNEIRDTFGATLFNSEKTNIYIDNILSKGDISDVALQIDSLIIKLKQ